jgi:hypothetical protein
MPWSSRRQRRRPGFADEIVGDRPVDAQMDLRSIKPERMLAATLMTARRQRGVFADGDELSIFYRHSTFDNTL